MEADTGGGGPGNAGPSSASPSTGTRFDPVAASLAAAAAAPMAVSAPQAGVKRGQAYDLHEGGGHDEKKHHVGALTAEEDLTLNEPLDYSVIMDLDEVELNNKTDWSDEQIARGKKVGFELLDEYHVYDVEPEANAVGQAYVDTTWAVSRGKDGDAKCRIVGREFKWASSRTDTFAAASNPLFGRVIDFLSLKDDDDPTDELVCFEADAICAYYQAPETEVFYAKPPPEWLAVRRSQGLDCNVVWRLRKQLPGRRAGGAKRAGSP